MFKVTLLVTYLQYNIRIRLKFRRLRIQKKKPTEEHIFHQKGPLNEEIPQSLQNFCNQNIFQRDRTSLRGYERQGMIYFNRLFTVKICWLNRFIRGYKIDKNVTNGPRGVVMTLCVLLLLCDHFYCQHECKWCHK